MWRPAELTRDYKEGDRSLQLRLEDDTVSAGRGAGLPGPLSRTGRCLVVGLGFSCRRGFGTLGILPVAVDDNVCGSAKPGNGSVDVT